MNRRSLLASGALLIAGCSGQDPPSDPSTSTTDTSTATATDTAAPTATETAASTPTEEPTPTESPTSTATPEPTAAEKDLQSAIEELNSAMSAYERKNGTMNDVTPSMSFPFKDVQEHVEGARHYLGEAEDEFDESTPEEIRQLHSKLRGVFRFFWWSARIQRSLGFAWDNLQEAEEQAYANNQSDVSNTIGQFNSDVSSALSYLEDLEEDSDPSDTTAPTNLTEELYSERIDQFESDIETLRSVKEVIESCASVIEATANGTEQYNSREYDSASTTFYEVASDFEDVAEEAGSISGFTNDVTSDMRCIAGAMSEGCAELETAAVAVSNGNSSKQRSAIDNAEDEFERCDLVMDKVTPIIQFYNERPSLGIRLLRDLGI